LSAAARKLHVNQSTLGRQIQALESELGVTLFEKVGRGFEITPTGLELLEHVERMADAANQLSLTASGKSQELTGLVSISASEANAVLVLPELLKEFQQMHPAIQIEIVSRNEASDLLKREADLAIRNFEPEHPDLIGRELPKTSASLYASADYLQSLGDLEDLYSYQKAAFVGFVDNRRYMEGLQALGLPIDESNFRWITKSHLAQWELVKSGAGIGVMIDVIASKEAKVTRLPHKIPSFPVTSWLIAHRELRTNRKIRLVFDFLVSKYSELLESQ